MSTFLIMVTQNLSSLYFFFLDTKAGEIVKGFYFFKVSVYAAHCSNHCLYFLIVSTEYDGEMLILDICTFVNMYSDLYVKMKAALIKMISSMGLHLFIDFLMCFLHKHYSSCWRFTNLQIKLFLLPLFFLGTGTNYYINIL